MSNDGDHTTFTIDVTTYKDRYVLRVVDDSNRHLPLFDVNAFRAPHAALVDSLASMSKVLADRLRLFIIGYLGTPPAVPSKDLCDYLPFGFRGLPTIADLGKKTKKGKR